MTKAEMTKWTRRQLEVAVKILKHHRDLHEAVVEIEKAVGFKVGANSMRRAFYRHQMGHPSSHLKPSPKVEVPRRMADMTPAEALKVRVEAKEKSRKRHQQGLTEIIIEKVESALAKIAPDTLRVTPEGACDPAPDVAPELLWCEVSDVQLGTRVDSEHMGGINSHDWAVFTAKLARWEEVVTATIRERRAVAPIEGVVIALLGDLVEGHGIFKGQAYELDLSVYEQVVYGARDFAQAFSRIIATFPDLRFTLYNVGGNHGRVGPYGEAPYRANFDLIIAEIIRLRIEALGLKNVECHFPTAWFQVVETWGWTHLLVHGDDIKGWGGLPFYGLQRAVAKWGQVLRRPVNYLHIGHHHAEAAISSSVGDAIVNGNWIGGNAFTKVIVEANTPVQLVHGITEANGVEWTRKIYLRTRQEMAPRLTVHRHGSPARRVRDRGRAA